jgi:tRNA threonylcarbamoyl adenosine modification protein YeaZ
MKVIVLIDTTNNKEVTVGLKIDAKEFIEKKLLDTRKAQVVLPMLEKMLEKHDLQMNDITGIEVNPGPGSFTGIRVGLSIANTLGFLLKIPVNGKNPGESEATYN